MKLLTLNQAKMLKSHKLGYISAVLNLSPAYNYRGQNTCPNAGQCKALCLQGSGRNRFEGANLARIRRTKLYYDNQNVFYTELIADIQALIRKANREGLLPTVRLNGLSDIAFEDDNVLATGKNIFELFPDLQFIDYTKRYTRLFKSLPANYHLTYSINELTPAGIVSDIMTKTRFNCAAVFYPEIPQSWPFSGKNWPIVSGDDSDLRHLDPRGCVIGLRYKLSFHKKTGKAIRPTRSGFIILTNQ